VYVGVCFEIDDEGYGEKRNFLPEDLSVTPRRKGGWVKEDG
jgi:hypothetical protein